MFFRGVVWKPYQRDATPPLPAPSLPAGPSGAPLPKREQLRRRFRRKSTADDDTITTLERFAAEWNDRVVIEPIDPTELETHERTVLDLAGDVLALIGRRRDEWDVVVSETLHLTPDGTETARGLWDPSQRRIVIHRSCLASGELFVGTLLHEIGHAITGATDLTARFEDGLTDLLGTVGNRAVISY